MIRSSLVSPAGNEGLIEYWEDFTCLSNFVPDEICRMISLEIQSELTICLFFLTSLNKHNLEHGYTGNTITQKAEFSSVR